MSVDLSKAKTRDKFRLRNGVIATYKYYSSYTGEYVLENGVELYVAKCDGTNGGGKHEFDVIEQVLDESQLIEEGTNMGKECICYKAEQHNSEEIAHIKSVHSLVGLDLEYDASYKNHLLNVNSSDGTEFKVKINYCPMCGRKLKKIGSELNEKLKELLQ